MKVFRDPAGSNVKGFLAGLDVVVTIGVFDGAHLGHQMIFSKVVGDAIVRGSKSGVVSFDPHPALVTRPENAPKLLTNLDKKLELLSSAGFDAAFIFEFNEELMQLTAREFVEKILVDTLSVRKVIVGEDFHFGKKREGDINTLISLGGEHGFEVEGLNLLTQVSKENLYVSSTEIRRALVGGEIEKANQMLGRPHEVSGVVIHGDKRGREIGFPTANVMVDDIMAMPADAVYAGWFIDETGSKHKCAINLGKRPTFHQDATKSLLEAHLIGFTGDLYEQVVHVQFVELIRSEKRFAGLEELKVQLAEDVKNAAQVLT